MEVFASVLVGIVLCFIAYEGLSIAWYSYLAVVAGKKVTPFSRILTNPRKHVLVIGDSTSYGTGASSSEHSLVGLLGQEFPDIAITNKSKNALNLKELADRMQDIHGTYDVIQIHIGGIDTLSFTSDRSMLSSWERIYTRIQELKIPTTILVTVNNVGLGPFMKTCSSVLYRLRSRHMNRFFTKLAETYQIEHVSLYDLPGNDPLAKNPDVLFSKDKIHPSDAGYKLWYERISPVAQKYLGTTYTK